ncbi:DNA repair protein RecN [Acidithiobacillus sp. AMEEHan]|uniref:DNA repair protein RecN n=1 Tax=Acidithiobacillus sp. AMEEHan TaxID=2994951 RepID=UPI0027E50245|nr:DNA repair protein RecN [Acidithiobacillus sp. AMEEHan]
MLLDLQIRDFALIRQLDIEFDYGLTVLTGETGAGKSILIDAIALLLGDKGSPQMVRHGAEQAEIIGSFSASPATEAWLAEQGLSAEDNILVLRRILPIQGRSRLFLNGRAISSQQARDLGTFLLDVLGQHAHLQLLKPERQLALIDRFANNDALRAAVAASWQQWRAAQQEWERHVQNQANDAAQREWRQFVYQELQQARLRPGEWEELQEEEQRLAAVEQIRAGVDLALHALDEEGGALLRLAEAQRGLSQAAHKDPHLADSLQLLDAATIQANELVEGLRGYLHHLEAEPERLEEVARRLQELQDLQRKHRCDMVGLLALQDELATEFAADDSGKDPLGHAAETLEKCRRSYLQQAEALSATRHEAAPRLAMALQEQVRSLGMQHAVVELRLEVRTAEKSWTTSGIDQVEFWISVNPGHPAQPLAQVASGGELARISLALQVLLKLEGVETLIFDEVDVGIGGAVAERIGRLLRQLGATHQVLCVTHLPQVAAHGHQHLYVEKAVVDGQTESRLRLLQSAERGDEIARMLGGSEIDASLQTAAQKLLQDAARGSGSPQGTQRR